MFEQPAHHYKNRDWQEKLGWEWVYERQKRIRAARERGQTLEQIGKSENICRERVRQILYRLKEEP